MCFSLSFLSGLLSLPLSFLYDKPVLLFLHNSLCYTIIVVYACVLFMVFPTLCNSLLMLSCKWRIFSGKLFIGNNLIHPHINTGHVFVMLWKPVDRVQGNLTLHNGYAL